MIIPCIFRSDRLGGRPASAITPVLLAAVLAAGIFALVTAPAARAQGWSAPSPIEPYNNLSVSCASSSFCVAVGSTSGDVYTYDGGGWSKPSLIDPGGLTSVSCASSSFCVAVDRGGDVLIYNGGGWSAPSPIDPGSSPDLESVSCASSSFCVALDYSDDEAFTYNGGGWSAPSPVSPYGLGLNSVSCASSSFCAAVDSQGNALEFGSPSPSPPSPPASTDPGA
ncbi:MAG: hypothetical protein ACYC0H_09235, partial [Solirubrobacteraceae bacterium]